MAAETQSFIDALKNPSHMPNDTRQTALEAFAQYLRADGMQIIELRARLQEAELTETDDILRGKFEVLFQKLGALERQQRKMAEEARRVRQTIADVTRIWQEDLRGLAQDAGYMVD